MPGQSWHRSKSRRRKLVTKSLMSVAGLALGAVVFAAALTAMAREPALLAEIVVVVEVEVDLDMVDVRDQPLHALPRSRRQHAARARGRGRECAVVPWSGFLPCLPRRSLSITMGCTFLIPER